MNVVFVAPRFHTNQVEVVRALIEAGHTVGFHVTAIGGTEDHSVLVPRVFEPCMVSRLFVRAFGDGGVNGPRIFPSPWAYWKHLRTLAPDLVIVRAPNRAFSFLAAMCARLRGAKVVFYTQGRLSRPYSVRERVLIRLLLFAFNAAWYTPLSGNRCLPNGRPPKGMYYVPFAVARVAAKLRDASGGFKLLMVGKYQPRKNHALLLRAVARLSADFDIELTMAGECVDDNQSQVKRELDALVENLGLTDRVTLLCNVPYRDMPDLYLRHDLFVLPSSRESAAISVLEALATGMPVVCSDTCGTQDYLLGGQVGRVFRSDDADDLVEQIRAVVGTRNGLPRMSAAAIEAFEGTMSKQAYLDGLYAMLADRWSIQPPCRMR